MRYLVTTHADRLPADVPILMVDGTVPGWVAKRGDHHWDHHRTGGAEIQIDEMPFPAEQSLIQTYGSESACIVTTMVDADACCAAAWLQLPASVLTPATISRLRAIAWDCDHLHVPPPLHDLSEFAANAVATLKLLANSTAQALELPPDRRSWSEAQWERFNSDQFRRGTEWLIAAAKGKCPYPGTAGEAEPYWQHLAQVQQQHLDEKRITLIPTDRGEIGFCNLLDFHQPVDPRAFHRGLAQAFGRFDLRPETLVLRDHRRGGYQYTLGCLPGHPETADLDYTAGIFERLTAAERLKQPQSGSWGGRRTVGGSAWNTPSQLEPLEVIAQLDAL